MFQNKINQEQVGTYLLKTRLEVRQQKLIVPTNKNDSLKIGIGLQVVQKFSGKIKKIKMLIQEIKLILITDT